MTQVGLIDCGTSNLTSARNAFEHLGFAVEATRDPEALSGFSHLVLPGVGSFVAGMANLAADGMDDAIRQAARAGKPLLGICLGMQLLAEAGEEFGDTAGLGLVPGRIGPLSPADDSLRLPHIGWNEVDPRGDSQLLAGLDLPTCFYFVHGFGFDDPAAAMVRGVCDYGGPVVAVIEQDNVCGVQFHPEKSQAAGLALLGNFIGSC